MRNWWSKGARLLKRWQKDMSAAKPRSTLRGERANPKSLPRLLQGREYRPANQAQRVRIGLQNRPIRLFDHSEKFGRPRKTVSNAVTVDAER